MNASVQKPSIVSSVILRKGDLVAFVLRENTTWMNGFYGLAASGRVEVGESFTQAAIREAKEETGVDLKPEQLRQIHIMHCKVDNPWIHVYFEAKYYEGTPYNADPDAHSELAWFSINALPKNTMPLVVTALKAIMKGEAYSEFGWEASS